MKRLRLTSIILGLVATVWALVGLAATYLADSKFSTLGRIESFWWEQSWIMALVGGAAVFAGGVYYLVKPAGPRRRRRRSR